MLAQQHEYVKVVNGNHTHLITETLLFLSLSLSYFLCVAHRFSSFSRSFSLLFPEERARFRQSLISPPLTRRTVACPRRALLLRRRKEAAEGNKALLPFQTELEPSIYGRWLRGGEARAQNQRA